MKNKSGWITLHRKLLDNPISSKPSWAWLWVVLLLLANHDENSSFIWNGEKIILKKGQFVTGRKKLKSITGISETTIERILNYLENEQQIGQQKTTKYRLITILKWDLYQNKDNKRTTNGQQTDTFNNDNNDNNIIYKAFKEPTIEEVDIYCKERKNTVNPQKFIDFYKSKGWMVGKNKMKDWKACVRTWEGNSFNKIDNLKVASGKYNNIKKTTINDNPPKI